MVRAMRKRKQRMPSFYGKNIAQNAQRRFLARWDKEHPKKTGGGLSGHSAGAAGKPSVQVQREK